MRYERSTKSIRVKYLRYESNGIVRYLPMVHIVLTNDDVVLPTIGLVDSGATSTFIPLCMAQLLKLGLSEKNDDVTGAGGNFISYVTKIEKIDIVKHTKVFVSFENQIIRVPEHEDGIPFVILGRDSIFRRLTIKFEEDKQQIQLRKNKIN